MNRVEEWFDPIYSKYHDILVRFAYQTLHDKGLAEDIVHSAFLTLLVKYEEMQGHPNLKGWLVQTVKYKILNELQKPHHKSEIPLPAEYEPAASEAPSDLLSVLPPGLSEDERQILYLYYEVGFSHKEIAERIGCSQAASRMRLFRAKQHCGSLMSGDGGGQRPEQEIF